MSKQSEPGKHETEVYAIHGADPETLAYAMAKYSRSALTMRESLAEITSQSAEKFLNTFYFQYGHRSIADLAHLPFAIERLSLLAAITLVDEQRWDGQERSTRYQDFKKSGWYTPALGDLTGSYDEAIGAMFLGYEAIASGMLEQLKDSIVRPASMSQDAYDRSLKARAYDVARYTLPLATNTSLGQIVNARTLEMQISRLLTSEFAEIRSLGEKLREAATKPAWDVRHAEFRGLSQEVGKVDASAQERMEELLLKPVRVAPTLVKYAAESDYQSVTRSLLRHAADDLLDELTMLPAPVVDLVEDSESLEVELAASLLYPNCHHSFRQIRDQISGLSGSKIQELIELGTRLRGHHDELLRPFASGNRLRFDIMMDIGGFRDMHRHRRCIQLLQGFTDLHGYEEPVCPGQPTLEDSGLETRYRATMDDARVAFRKLRDSGAEEAASSAQYLLPLGTRCRSLFKMDFAEALYIAELRSGAAGHFSYRLVAWEMYQEISRKHPGLASLFRIRDVHEPINLLQR